MTEAKYNELVNLAAKRMSLANKHLGYSDYIGSLKEASTEAEIPGFENKNPKFGDFTDKVFVAMMTDIRDSTSIVKSPGGVQKMFKIFYVYSAVVANIVDSWKGTATEFLGDGVINLFDTDLSLDESLKNSMGAAQDILEARQKILNPLFAHNNLPLINLGIGISHGDTIVTRFGYKGDNDLKAFGECVYEVAKTLCKGHNEIRVSATSQVIWPTAVNGTLMFEPKYDFTTGYSYSKATLKNLLTHA